MLAMAHYTHTDGDVATMPVYMDEDDGTVCVSRSLCVLVSHCLNPLPLPPTSQGKWVKFMSSKGCNCYCHSITCQVLFSRPSEYESDEEEVDASSIPKVKLTAIAVRIQEPCAMRCVACTDRHMFTL